jgi:hypothetical protein
MQGDAESQLIGMAKGFDATKPEEWPFQAFIVGSINATSDSSLKQKCEDHMKRMESALPLALRQEHADQGEQLLKGCFNFGSEYGGLRFRHLRRAMELRRGTVELARQFLGLIPGEQRQPIGKLRARRDALVKLRLDPDAPRGTVRGRRCRA